MSNCYYLKKLYVLLGEEEYNRQLTNNGNLSLQWQQQCDRVRFWGQQQARLTAVDSLPYAIAAASDRVYLDPLHTSPIRCTVKHPISGESTEINTQLPTNVRIPTEILQTENAELIYWWFWRFYPERLAEENPDFWMHPAHYPLPDCSLHSFRSTMAALAGTLYPREDLPTDSYQHPYLLLFTFSPIQDFIQASRKFIDFWSSSYILHYLSACVCWHIAQKYGPDAVVTPSLWGQDIIDAFFVQKYPELAACFGDPADVEQDPASQFELGESISLSTAGFPNTIVALVPQSEVRETAAELSQMLRETWCNIAHRVRDRIRDDVIQWLQKQAKTDQFASLFQEYDTIEERSDRRDLEKWQKANCWEWNKLWDVQIENTWQTYWTALPLGHPEHPLTVSQLSNLWEQAQAKIVPPTRNNPIPSNFERQAYDRFNVGSWWGLLQARLGKAMQSVKNTRTWSYGASPGNRSTLSGQGSAVHPGLHYHQNYREGAGLPAGSLRLFWYVMGKVYPGLFNGSEQLNAMELSKRMAWHVGGVAEHLGIELQWQDVDYELLVSFPNISSIAAARFLYEDFSQNRGNRTKTYWNCLNQLLGEADETLRQQFARRTRGRSTKIPKIDAAANPENLLGEDRNGVMFDSKWLVDDLGLDKQGDAEATLRLSVEKAHQQSGFTEASPSDWWAIVLADGDGMGQYISGGKLQTYRHYVVSEQVDPQIRQQPGWEDFLDNTHKRMGPATHVGLNRALLDFSNRIVPYLTQQRFCGRVVYSGGDDVMVILPIEDLPEFLLSLRSAWCGGSDPQGEFQSRGGYWMPSPSLECPQRPLFTMGAGATMSAGAIVAHKSVPLPTVLEKLWEAESDRAKKIFGKDGLCVRTIYSSGNTLEFVTKGSLLADWWQFARHYRQDLAPFLYRLAAELPKRATFTNSDRLFRRAAQVILSRRDRQLSQETENALLDWLDAWEDWAKTVREKTISQAIAEFLANQKGGMALNWENIDYNLLPEQIEFSGLAKQLPKQWLLPLRKTIESQLQATRGVSPKDLGNWLRFSAFWTNETMQRENLWRASNDASK